MVAIFDPLQRPQNERTDLDVAVGTRAELADNDAAVARHDAAVKSLKEQIEALDSVVRERYFRSGETKLPRAKRTGAPAKSAGCGRQSHGGADSTGEGNSETVR